ncbi:MAG: hypothetical protein J0M12_03100 [Deltaproteobacteria bacterium]|nr:hypothetical protein [Deltaproteobacteria bacterium]
MKKSLCSNPEPFSLSPLLALLPVRGQVGKLEALTSSLFARFEKVLALQKELELNPDSSELSRRPASEAAMLRQVLDWLAVKPGTTEGS